VKVQQNEKLTERGITYPPQNKQRNSKRVCTYERLRGKKKKREEKR